jgi:hypothetical protein
MDHRAFRELAAGAALRDLSRGERWLLRLHELTCRTCGDLRRDLDDTAAMLSLAPRQRPAPDALRAAVLRSITSDAAVEDRVAGEIAALRRETRRLRAWSVAGLAAAAVLAIAVAGLGVRTVSLSDQLGAAEASSRSVATRLAGQEGAIAVALAPGHVTTPLGAMPAAPGALASVVYEPGSTQAYLVAQRMPPTPSGHVYQLWVADDTGVHPLGTFTYDGSGVLVADFATDLAGKKAAMLTLEPEGGATSAPGPELLFGEL